MSNSENNYPYGKIARITIIFTIIIMVVVFYFGHPRAYTTKELHEYEDLANAIITKGAITLTAPNTLKTNNISQPENTPTLYYDKITIIPTDDNQFMLNIINDKKGDIEFKFDSSYTESQATIAIKGYWIQCFMETFVLAPGLSFPIFFIIFMFIYEIYRCKKNNIPFF